MGNILLETNRLILRKLSLGDAKLMLKYSQEEITKKELPDEVFKDIKHMKKAIEFFITHYDWEYNHCFPIVYGIILKQNNTIIGHICLSEMDRGIEISYAIATDYQNNGYASETISPFVVWSKNHLRINEIYGVAKRENIQSWKILEKNGFKLIEEGLFKNYFEGKYVVKIYVK